MGCRSAQAWAAAPVSAEAELRWALCGLEHRLPAVSAKALYFGIIAAVALLFLWAAYRIETGPRTWQRSKSLCVSRSPICAAATPGISTAAAATASVVFNVLLIMASVLPGDCLVGEVQYRCQRGRPPFRVRFALRPGMMDRPR